MLFREILSELLNYPVSDWYRHEYGKSYDREITYGFIVGDQSSSVGRFSIKFVQMDYDASFFNMKLYRLEENGSGEAKRSVKRADDARLQFKLYPTVIAVIKDFINGIGNKVEIGFVGADDRLSEFYAASRERFNKEMNEIGYEVAQYVDFVDKKTGKEELGWNIQPIGTKPPEIPKPRSSKKD